MQNIKGVMAGMEKWENKNTYQKNHGKHLSFGCFVEVRAKRMFLIPVRLGDMVALTAEIACTGWVVGMGIRFPAMLEPTLN